MIQIDKSSKFEDFVSSDPVAAKKLATIGGLSLFWRTFLLIGGLLGVCLIAALVTFNATQQAPKAQRLALQIASLVNLTRNALVSAQPQRRVQLLDQIAREEGARVRLLEPSDVVVAPATDRSDLLVQQRLSELLGDKTKFASQVNAESAWWLSFAIDDDQYWLAIEPQRLANTGPNWWWISLLVISLAVISAWVISQLVNRPLQSLARAIRQLASGKPAQALPENGPTELALINQQFNRLAHDLAQLDADRSLALAGISHDIRTPLTRLRLELEFAKIPDADRDSMIDEITRIDSIIGQFIDYARASGARPLQHTAIAPVLEKITAGFATYTSRDELEIDLDCAPDLACECNPVDLERMIVNLMENARRYGKAGGGTAGDATGKVRILCAVTLGEATQSPPSIRIRISDDGAGVPADQMERLLRPFARMDLERSEAGGSGLGLAIVNRLAQRLGGSLVLSKGVHPQYLGLCATIILPVGSTQKSV